MAIKEIIETLVTVFKVEAEGVKQGVDNIQRDVNRGEKALNRMGDSAKKTSQQITGLAGDVKKLSSVIQIAATTMGLFKVMNNNIGVGNLSERTGQSVKGIQALQRQFEKMGYSAEEANASIQGFSNGLAAVIFKGEGEGLMLPAMFGVDVFKANGEMRDAVEVMLEIGDAARKMMGSEEKAIMLLQQYGMTASQAHFAAREASRAEYAAEKERAKLDMPRIEKMRKINRTLADQKTAISDLASEMLVQLNPTIIRAGEGIKTLTDVLTENQQATTLALKGWIAFKAFGINPVLGAIVAAGLALDRFNDLANESVKIGGSQGTYLQNLIMTDPETGASVADVLPERDRPTSYEQKSPGKPPTGVLNAREQALANTVHGAESNLPGSNNGYNAVNRGRGGGYRAGVEDLTSMSVGEVMAAQRAQRFNAAGRYQVIGKTMAEAVKALGIEKDTKFDESTQDRIFQYLVNKRKGSRDYLRGKSDDLTKAQYSVSQEWAGIANPYTGRSYYDKVANNKANLSTAQFASNMMGAGNVGAGSSLVDSRRQFETDRTAQIMNQPNGTITTSNSRTVHVDKVVIHAENADANGVKDAFVSWATGAHDFNTGAAA